ncbi:hypothetical protein ACFWUU_01105 [Kribbella sp. NPDC058693]|uniref:hypothetical protein n=1 Tax=Kribbella sp. NPDC058693 TaxID=3346602 RepID=UPI003648DF65
MLVYEPFVNITGTAQMYSQIAGVLAGFAFTALLGFLRSGASSADGQGGVAANYTLRSVSVVLFSTMTALIISSVLYGILAGGQNDSGSSFSAVVIDGPSFSLAILSMFYAIGLAATPYAHLDAMLAAVRVIVGVVGPLVALVLVDTAVLDIYHVTCGFYATNTACHEFAQLAPSRPYGFGLTLTLIGLIISSVMLFRFRKPPAAIPMWVPKVVGFIVLGAAVLSVAGIVAMTPMQANVVPTDGFLYAILIVVHLMTLTISILAMWSCHPTSAIPNSSAAVTTPEGGASIASDSETPIVGHSQVTREELAGRYGTYLTTHYLGLHVTVISVALGVAGLAAASLVAASQNLSNGVLLNWMLWLSSLLAVAVAYAGTMTGAIGLPARVPTLLDLAVPLLMAVVEVLLFGVLVSQIVDLNSERAIITSWFLLISIFGLLAMAAILRARHYFQVSAYTAELADTIVAYRWRLRFDIAGAAVVTALGAVGSSVQLARPAGSITAAFYFAGAVITCLVLALFGHGQTARLWRVAMTSHPSDERDPRRAAAR